MTQLPTDQEIEYITDEELKMYQNHFTGFEKGAFRILPDGWFFPTCMLKGFEQLKNFEVRATDVYVITYPKCGTTWVQEIIWTMIHNPTLDHPQAHLGINLRSPYLECDFVDDQEAMMIFANLESKILKEFLELYPDADTKKPLFLQAAEMAKDPRIIKSHLPLSLLDPKLVDKAKVVYVARNPKDTCVSYYHHNRLFVDSNFSGTLDEFVNYFIEGKILYGRYDKHVAEAWRKRDQTNFHILFYENLKKNPENEIGRLDKFLGTKLSGDQIKNIVQYTSFEEMKKRDGIITNDSSSNKEYFVLDVLEKEGGFFRKGEVGSYKNKITPVLEAQLDAWINKTFKEIGVPFSYST